MNTKCLFILKEWVADLHPAKNNENLCLWDPNILIISAFLANFSR